MENYILKQKYQTMDTLCADMKEMLDKKEIWGSLIIKKFHKVENMIPIIMNFSTKRDPDVVNTSGPQICVFSGYLRSTRKCYRCCEYKYASDYQNPRGMVSCKLCT